MFSSLQKKTVLGMHTQVLCYHSLTGNRSIYDYEIDDVHGAKSLDWSLYRGSVILVVNVASF